MRIPSRRLVLAAAVLAVAASTALSASVSQAADDGRDGGGGRGHGTWVGTWAAGMTAGSATGGLTHTGIENQSVRMIVHTSIGGDGIRIRLANTFGDRAVQVGHATVARPNAATPELTDVDPASLRELTFGGHPSGRILKGAELFSDPVDLPVAAGEDLVVTLYFPVLTGPMTIHTQTRESLFLYAGDHASDASGAAPARTVTCCWMFLSGVDVVNRRAGGTVVVLGDSIADGFGTTLNANQRWPDLLARRLVAAAHAAAPGVLNEGVSGNRLLHDGIEPGFNFTGFNESGLNAPARLAADVYAQPGVGTVLVDLGINDIWMSDEPADGIIDALRLITAELRERNLRVVLCTLAPFEGYGIPGSWTPEKEATRQAVNGYLRSHRPEFDGLVDFDVVLRDPAHPSQLRPELDSGDHIHPNDAGNQVMADAVRLSQLH
jgi:lysophospholipase L1-like esterase